MIEKLYFYSFLRMSKKSNAKMIYFSQYSLRPCYVYFKTLGINYTDKMMIFKILYVSNLHI